MKVAFTGKGGSGKTTLSSSFVRQLALDNYSVLAIDADINQHLAAALQVTDELVSMGEDNDKIKAYLKGSNTRFTNEQMHKTTPPGTGSQLIQLRDGNWFIKRYTVKHDSVYVAGAGEIPEGNIGVKCYHGLNGAIELVLGHFVDADDEFVVFDMTAGADAFSSSLFTKVDALVLVVEPTLKSLNVYDQFLPHAKAHGIPLFVVGNKIENDDDRLFIEAKTGPLAAVFEVSNFIKRKERGQITPDESVEQTMADALRALRKMLLEQVLKDWSVIEKRSHEMHRKNAKSWMGESALGHIDPEFSLKHVAETLLQNR
jgi:CO dehydrogenase maturation factor